MENMAKALIIAGGVFFTVLIVTLLMLGYNRISDYYKDEHDFAVMEQTEKFNKRFENYNKDNIRGSDLISLMNRVIDYNATESYQEDKNYERIRVVIKLGNNDILSQFRYETDTTGVTNNFLISEITNTTGSSWQNDRELVVITNTPEDLMLQAEILGVNNVTDTTLKQLSSNISNIFVDEDSTDPWAITQRFKRAEVIKNILGISIDINKSNGKSISTKEINNIKKIASQYYQYTQFKRAYFSCETINYNPETGRVVEMIFKLQTKKDDNGNTIVVFDE